MHTILVMGAGKIGTTIAHLLAMAPDYEVILSDTDVSHLKTYEKIKPRNVEIATLDITQQSKTTQFIQSERVDALVSCLPYYCTFEAAKIAHSLELHYFDLTEDVAVTQKIAHLAQQSPAAFVSQCGVAPGFINIVANDMMRQFHDIHEVKLRCGALPRHASNALQYAITWSVDGLINEYKNPCQAILEGKMLQLEPLTDLEHLQFDGNAYEAFNTSGGLGTLAQTYANQVDHMSYKTIRYPGHCEKMYFLMNELQLKHDVDTLKKILGRTLPTSKKGVVIIYVSVSGTKDNERVCDHYLRKYRAQTLGGMECSAIQATTASSACAIVDIILKHPGQYKGPIKQEDFNLNDVLTNRFGRIFA